MTLEALKDRIGDYAKDVRLNFSYMLSDETLPQQTKYGLFLAVALAVRNKEVTAAFKAEAQKQLSPEALHAAKAAASIMAMNNVYYRFLSLAENKDYKSRPARLRMNVIANPGVDKNDFELWSLAVSAINGCATCVDAHEKALQDGGVSTEVIHTAVRFASIIASIAVALEAGEAV